MADHELLVGLGELRKEHGPFTTALVAAELLHPVTRGMLIERQFLQMPYSERVLLLASLEAQVCQEDLG